MADRRRPDRGSPAWVLVLVALPFVLLFIWGSWHGWCADSATPEVPSVCYSGPAVGWEGAWVLTGVAAILAVVAIVRLVRR